MERGYLVAVLAVVATFTGLSHSFRSLDQWWVAHIHNNNAAAKAQCPAAAAARALARIEAHVRPHAEAQQQLLAELNPPTPGVPAAIYEDLSGQESAVRCARERAMQDADRARRDMARMQREIERATQNVRVDPLSLQINLPADLEKQIEESTKMAERMATARVRVQILTNQRNIAVKSETPEQ
jgi:hypothetical protein